MARAGADGNGGSTAAKPGASASAANEKDGSSEKPGPADKSDARDANAPANSDAVSLEEQVQQLRDLLAAQSKELAETQDRVKAQQEKMQALEDRLSASGGGIANPSATLPHLAEPVSGAATGAAEGGGASQSSQVSPLQLKLGSAFITPVGFMDFTSVWRNRDAGSGIGTNFAGIPYGGAGAYQTNLSETRFSMQNSRIGFRVDADVKGSHVIGYMESDFLGNNPSNVAVSSNSNTMRSRLYWVDVRKGGLELLGGQTWSLATPNRLGVSPLPGDVFFSYNMDVNYQLGMVWGRIPEFRLAYHFPGDKAAFAVALDSPDQYVGGTNGSAAITPPACCTYYVGGQADNGTTTLGPPNRGPDVIAKFVVDPSKRLHAEVGGIARFFELYNQTTTTHFSTTGGAGFANLDFAVFNGFRLLTHNYWSDGGGRYIFGQAPDLIARADGSPSLVHSGSTVDGVEFTRRNSSLFSYYGLAYISRNVAIDTNGKPIGWGYVGAPSGQNRSIQEGTFGFSQNFWKDPRYGALSLIGQYSYLTRDPWSIATGSPKNAHASMAFLDLRYTLPGSAPTLGKPGKE
jgi:uncharacterized coiled-coil protein SlyX